ncbi:hypothetical protein [Rubellicoccus peritrichatus]|uniref:Uncharacterized protein n=1 Tax=Rubellicoccus peritrichatus TaxID=3080537 RepID=A0AAQ3L7D4_9BACT|nr:hypothetical protein [Puniceicoccus sp. CR14]WOO40346.1 hypothetical protein RZN69_17140 [Puniceicoccus sp. CR14]
MTEFLKLFELAKAVVEEVIERKREIKDSSWEELIEALDDLSEITRLHAEAIAEVTLPIEYSNDLLETAHRYSRLAKNPYFPQGYSAIRGTLESCLSAKMFKAEAIQSHLTKILDELSKFQEGAFLLSWDSFSISDAFAKSVDVYNSDSENDFHDFREEFQKFKGSYDVLMRETSKPDELEQPSTKEDLVAVLRSWCISWQRHIHNILYRGRGLNYEIHRLKKLKNFT